MSPIAHTAAAGKRPGRFRRFRAPLAWLTFPAVLAVMLLSMLSGAPASGASTSVSFVQGTAFSTAKVTSTTVSMSKPVSAGDLLVGWFAQYAVTGNVQVSDNVNGAWTRAPSSEQFNNGQGDIALYYLAGSKAAAGGIKITVSAATAAYLQGTVAEYSGIAATGPLVGMAVARASSSAVNSGATSSVPAGQLVYAAEVTGVSPGAVPTPGSSAGLTYTERASTSSGSAFEEDITSGAAGAEAGTATLVKSTDWYAVVAAFTPASTTPSPTPTTTSPSPTPTTTSPTPTPTTTSPSPSPTTTSPTPTPTTTSPTPTPTTTSPSPTPTTTSPSPSSTPTGTPSPGSIGYVQGNWFATSPLTSTTVSLTQPVQAGDLLVGWFSQYGASGQVQVSDNVNGAWTRAPTSLAFQNDGGDIAMYYLANTKASASGVQITVSASSATYLDGTVAEYSGVALAGPLDQVVAARGVGTSVNAGSTAAVPAGELVYSAVISGQPAGGYTPGSSQGISYTTRISADSGSLDESDITSSAAGSQQGTATLSASTDWYAVAATFQPLPANSSPPTAPTGLSATSAASSRVSLQWSASTGSVQGYTVFRNGTAIGATKATTFLDQTAAPATSYTYTVDAFNAAGQQSAQSSPVQVTTPARSPTFVQGIATSPGSRASSLTLTLSQPVNAGDLLVGWFGEYNAAGQVQVSDNVNGTWTRAVSETLQQRNRRHRPVLPGQLEGSAERPDGHDLGIGSCLPAGGHRRLQRGGHHRAAGPGRGEQRLRRHADRRYHRCGPGRGTGRGRPDHRRPAGHDHPRNQPAGSVCRRCPERKRIGRHGGHPVDGGGDADSQRHPGRRQ